MEKPYVSKYDRTLDSLLTRAVDYTNDGMGGNQFNYGASATLPDGVIAFGATNGLTFFNPLDITAGYPIPSLYIERLEVNNKVVRSFESQDIVEQDIIFLPKVTLRHDKMWEFLDRLLNIALPRVRDFRGINPNSFDGRGNYALGIKEQLIFPEIEYDKIDKIRGMDIVVCTTAETDEEARELLRLMGAPFQS